MTITKAKYMKNGPDNNNTSVEMTKDGNVYYVPLSTTNTDYQNILKWVADGNTIEEAE
tara:strand:+ start:429 stop:602 length:174 start_codon:yes stop_codon:yes gene_type:complete